MSKYYLYKKFCTVFKLSIKRVIAMHAHADVNESLKLKQRMRYWCEGA